MSKIIIFRVIDGDAPMSILPANDSPISQQILDP